ncbi:hypothetical protein [Aliarcobacter butzleri]|uniref:hypothetical protein n=1 Tax=Aliarcobacter butzleri TaxID=28197 RepID=UPI003AF94E86
MNKKVEIIDLYKNKIRITEYRTATEEEIQAKINNGTFSGISDMHTKETIGEISNSYELATKILKDHINIENEINEILDKDKNYKNAKSSKTPASILKYQKTNTKINEKVNNEIHEHGVILTKGQELFHGGLTNTKEGDVIISKGVFSTSLNPYVARQNALHNGKAYDDNELNLNCIKIEDEDIRAFVFNARTTHGHEKELLLEKDIEIKVVKKTKVGEIEVTNGKSETKIIPKYVSEVEIKKLQDDKE